MHSFHAGLRKNYKTGSYQCGQEQTAEAELLHFVAIPAHRAQVDSGEVRSPCSTSYNALQCGEAADFALRDPNPLGFHDKGIGISYYRTKGICPFCGAVARGV